MIKYICHYIITNCSRHYIKSCSTYQQKKCFFCYLCNVIHLLRLCLSLIFFSEDQRTEVGFDIYLESFENIEEVKMVSIMSTYLLVIKIIHYSRSQRKCSWKEKVEGGRVFPMTRVRRRWREKEILKVNR